MILILCWMFPPLGVALMGKPFSAVLNLFLTAFLFWVPGVKHALICYADYRAERHVNRIVGAIHDPAHARNRCCRR